jgi:predicted NAD/FAD-dependent oxidoreductase
MDHPPRLRDVVVIGAGMTGLTAARILEREGLDVVVLDKGRAVGGRMATRRMGGGRFDHGAQHFSTRSDAFAEEVARWLAAGDARVWFNSRSITDPDRGVEPRHCGVDGMRGIPERLADGLEVATGVTVDRLDVDGRHVRIAAGGEDLTARSVVVTAPLPQSLTLFAASTISMPRGVQNALDGVTYDATLAVMALLEEASSLSNGHAASDQGPIAWLADNQHKGISAVPAVTIHSSADYAATHLDGEVADWTAELTAAAEAMLGVRVVEAVGHRWRYSQPRTTLDAGCVAAESPTSTPVILAGEVFAGARVEGAFLSGEAAAHQLLERLI